MRRLGGGLIALLVWLTALVLPVVALPTEACAAEGPRAALVVDTGEAVHRYCVALPEDEVSGLELITLAGEQHGLTYRFGYGGDAVCMLADVGTTGDDCFERYPDFWGYWRGTDDGGWTWSSTGAGSTTVRDGNVEGWSWGSGSDGSSHPRPPETAFSSVCPVVEEPNERPAPPKRSQKPNGPSGTATRATAPEAASQPDRPAPDRAPDRERSGRPGEAKRERPKNKKDDDRRRSQRKSLSVASPTPTRSPDALLASDDTTTAQNGNSPPAAGVAALGLAAALGAGGFVITRRRRGPS